MKISPKHCCTCSIDALCKLKCSKILYIGEVMDVERSLLTLVFLSKIEIFESQMNRYPLMGALISQFLVGSTRLIALLHSCILQILRRAIEQVSYS